MDINFICSQQVKNVFAHFSPVLRSNKNKSAD